MRIVLLRMYFIVLFGLVPLTGCQERTRTEMIPDSVPPPQTLRPTSHRELEDFFASQNYDWNTVHDGVPAFILEVLPGDLHQVSKVSKKKKIFFLSLLPMVLLANDEISSQRQRLEQIFDEFDCNHTLSSEEMDQLLALQKEYGIKGDPLHRQGLRRTFLERVDVIPPSLVLAQAATESAYGTSRFARRGNNLFGEWTFVPGSGLVPKNRPEGATYEVRRFRTVADSLHSYMRNINTNSAYKEFRHRRSELRAAGKPLRGLDLAGALDHYSTRGLDYVDELREIIRNNRLTRLSAAPLRTASEGGGLLSSADFIHRVQPAADGTTVD